MDNTSKLIDSLNALTKKLEDAQQSLGTLDGLSQQFTDAIRQQIDATSNQTDQLNDFLEQQKQIEKSKDKDKSKNKRQSQIMMKFQQQITKYLPNLTKMFSGFQKKLSDLTKTFSKFGSKLTGFFKNFKNPFAGLLKGKGGNFLKGAMGGVGRFGKLLASGAGKAIGAVTGKVRGGLQSLVMKLGPWGRAIGLFDKFIGFEKILKKIPLFSIMGKVIGGMWNNFKLAAKYGGQFAKVMVGLPLKIVGAMASKFGNKIRDDIVVTIGNAVEATKEFFDASSNLGRGLKGLADEGSKDLARTLNVRSDFVRLFGDGAQGISAFVGEISTGIQNMGPLADTVGATIAKNEVSAMQFVKATRSMGLSAEDVRFVTAESVKNGESLFDTLDRVMVSINKTSKETGLDQKKMSRNFFKLRTDIVNFGHLTNDELTKTTAKLTQMGLSMEEASAVFGKIDTFESAAQTSAMLSQTFGMNLDALQLLRAEKPEEIIEQFREAMLSTGRSFDQLNRHEKALMAQHTGLSAESLKLTMNYRNLGLTHEEIQKKLKENDPTQKQIENLELMNDSLKKINKTMQGDNFLTSFADGVVNLITRSSGLTPHLMRISERMEDFFINGLTITEKAKNTLENVFKPMSDVIVEMVGDGTPGNMGLFDPERFKGTFEKFTIKFGGLLSKAFDKDSNLVDLQYTIRNELKDTFDFDKINQGDTIVSQLFKTSGKFVGQILKGFAALGPGLIDVTFDALDSLIDFLVNYKDSPKSNGLFYDNSIKGMLSNLLGLDESDQLAIMNTFSHLIDRLIGASGPLMRLATWINVKLVGLVRDAMSAVMDAAEDGFKNSWVGAAISGLNFGSNKHNRIEGYKKAKTGNLSASYFDQRMLKELHDRENYESFETDQIGRLQYVLESEKKKQTFDVTKTAQINSMLQQIKEAEGQTGMGLDEDGFIKKITKSFADYRGITLDFDQANGYAESAKNKLLGPGKMATLKETPDGLRVTQLAPGDNLVAAKSGEISYAGNAASSLIKGMKYIMSPSNLFAGQENSNTGPSEIKIYMQVDGNNIAEAALDSGLLFKATQQKNGRYTLPGNVVVDASGNSVERTGV